MNFSVYFPRKCRRIMKVLFGFSWYIQISLVCLKSVKINLIHKAVLEAMIQGSN